MYSSSKSFVFSNINFYLNKSLSKCKVILPKEIIKNKNKNKDVVLASNELFNVVNYDNKLLFNTKIKMENITISNKLLKQDPYLKLKNHDKDNYSFETNNQIPLRWIYMLRDFYYPNIQIQNLNESVDYEKILYSQNENLIKYMLTGVFNQKELYGFVVHDNRWKTLNNKFSKFTENILLGASKFDSISKQNALQKCYGTKLYEPICLVEGGIQFNNEYVQDYIHFTYYYTQYCKINFVNNEIKNNMFYLTNKYINIEELLCLKLLLQKNNVLVSKINLY